MSIKKRIAIIGAGISGLSTAYHLHDEYQVTLFEKEDYVGGHTDTHELVIDNKTVNIDSGFIIFCREFYPNFCAMLDKIGVESQATNMSFSAHNRQSNVVYNATSPNKLFCQRSNFLASVSITCYSILFGSIRLRHKYFEVTTQKQPSLNI